jgi:hypothetical protein
MVIASLAMQVAAICDREDHDGRNLDPLFVKM